MVRNTDAFWQALVFTILILGIGIIIGVVLENSRSDSVQKTLMESEINLADERLRQEVLSEVSISCDDARKTLFEFADKIYDDAQKLEEYDGVAKFTEVVGVAHKRYDLLRTILWLESIKLGEKCGDNFVSIVYLYEYNPEGVELKAKQAYYSRVLLDLKYDNPEGLLLIPIAVNSNLSSLNLLTDELGVVETPAIILNGNVVSEDLVNRDSLNEMISERHN